MANQAKEFTAPPRTHDVLTPTAHEATRLSSHASMLFAHAVLGETNAVRLAIRQARTSLDRLDQLTRKEADA